VNTDPHEIVLMGKAERMLVEAATIDEVKHIRDTAEAARNYSKKIGLSQDITVHAAAIKVNAERKLGQLLKTIELAAGAPGNQYTGKKVNQSPDETGPVRLRDLGITSPAFLPAATRRPSTTESPNGLSSFALLALPRLSRTTTREGMICYECQEHNVNQTGSHPHSSLR
jgi:hypothetical protein